MLAEQEKEDSGMNFLELSDTVAVKRGGRSRFKTNEFDDHVPSEESDLQIMSINSANLPWKANLCMLSKNHPARDSKKCEAIVLSQTKSSSEVTSTSKA